MSGRWRSTFGVVLAGVVMSAGATTMATAVPVVTGAATLAPPTVYAWGAGASGQLGNGTTTSVQTTPVAASLPSGVTPTAVAAGSQTGYAVGSDGHLYAWGAGASGQLGNGTVTSVQTTPVVVSLPAGVTPTAVAAGSQTGYAVGSDGHLYAWGAGASGQLGNGTTTAVQTTPVVVSLPADVAATAVAAGYQTGYAVGSDDHLYAWGYGAFGQLGNGTRATVEATPVAVSLPAGVTATAVAGANLTGYAVGSDGHAYAWGYGLQGQLGNGTTTMSQASPVAVSLPAGVTATALAAGTHAGYVVGSDGHLYAWGAGGSGQLGNGTTASVQPVPVAVALPAGTVATSLGPEGASSTAYVVARPAVTLVQGSPTGADITTGAGFSGQLTITNEPAGGGTLTWSTTTPSTEIAVTSSGAVDVPTSVTTTGTVTVNGTVADAVGDSGTWSFTLTVHPLIPPLAITTTSLPAVTSCTSILGPCPYYLTTLAATGGVAPYVWSLASGSLPSGLSLQAGGTLQGWPFFAPTGSYPIVVQVTDAAGTAVRSDLTVVVTAPPPVSTPPLTVTTSSLPPVTACTSFFAPCPTYVASLSAAGGTPAYAWSLASGSLPAGLSLRTDGTITGWPYGAVAGAYPIVVRVTDATGATAQAALTLTVS